MDKYIDFFNDYISDYDLSLDALDRKKYHTFRVMDNCNSIAISLGLSKEEVMLANIIGLFHDIGRFFQYKAYSTFRDYETTDHAKLSVDVLKQTKILNDYKFKDIVYAAIINHNKLSIQEGLSEKENLFCKIIRDADKIDILNLVIQEKIKLGSFNSKYCNDAINKIIKGDCINPKDYSELQDKSLVKLGLFNDINFDYTKKEIISHKLIDKISDMYIKSNPISKDIINNIRNVLNERFGE